MRHLLGLRRRRADEVLPACRSPRRKARRSRRSKSLAKTGELSVLQKAFHKAGASQCGYCIPGMVMAATAALRANPFAGREEIKERLGGNICRCTGYQKIFDAVEMARDVQNGRLPATALAGSRSRSRRLSSARTCAASTRRARCRARSNMPAT